MEQPENTPNTPLYTPAHIANYMLKRAKKENRSISLLKLIKLVYISYGWALAAFHRRLFDEPILAWRYGPVIPSLYHEFKHYGRFPISEDDFSREYDMGKRSIKVPEVEQKPDADSAYENANIILDAVWYVYNDLDAWVLSNKTHENNTPWGIAWGKGPNTPLEDSDIKEHFKEKIEMYLKDDDMAA